uniref:Uncharacterized protein n=1 Tax=Cyclophora tenuis TaxID=216820 RepID=A0A7S1DBA1_CYCTE|mmetsp:Transcript_5789/g.10094  ORF Transcript_5789/g.10094 Transcript_5789/m.10094 type:complete len:198 (+) Transcript_5789:180-773(+)
MKMKGHSLPYDQLQRVCQQLMDYPDHQKWTLNVGKGWNVIREGGTLDFGLASSDVVSDADFEKKNPPTVLSWTTTTTTTTTNHQADLPDAIQITKSPQMTTATTEFFLSTGRHGSTWLFTPPWRSGHSPVKVKDFLRGQKIPLHLRKSTPLIYATTGGNPTVVAILVEGKWIVDAHFGLEQQQAGGETIQILLPTEL